MDEKTDINAHKFLEELTEIIKKADLSPLEILGCMEVMKGEIAFVTAKGVLLEIGTLIKKAEEKPQN